MRELHLLPSPQGAGAAAPTSPAVATLGRVVVLRLPALMDPAEFAASREVFLRVLAESGGKAAVVDCSGVEALDHADAEALRRLLVAASLVGSPPHLSGLRPGVAATLASLGPEFLRGVRVLRDLEEAVAAGGRKAGG